MTQGPLTKVGTKIAAVNLDISRKLNWGKGLVFEFLTVDRSFVDGWAIERTLTKGFDRIVKSKKDSGDGSEVTFEVADLLGTLGPVLRNKGLYVRVDDQVYGVSRVDPLASSEAQVFVITCKTRTLKTAFDTTKGK